MFVPTLPATAGTIKLVSISHQRLLIAGQTLEVKIRLKANPQPKIVDAFLLNSQSHYLRGTIMQIGGTKVDSLWNISIPTGDNIFLGEYKLNVRAKSGKSVWSTTKRTVTVNPAISVQTPTSPEITPRPNPDEPIQKPNTDISEPKHEKRVDETSRPDPNFKYGLDATCGSQDSRCPEISFLDKQTDVNECKIPDLTYPQDSSAWVSIGFPPNPYGVYGKKNVKLSWLPIAFSDIEPSDELIAVAQLEARGAEGFYGFNSFGRVKFQVDIPEKKNWIRFPEKYSYYAQLWQGMLARDVTRELIRLAVQSGLDQTDAIMFIWPPGVYEFRRDDNPGLITQYPLKNGSISSLQVYGVHDKLEISNKPEIIGFTHGMGHALYNFEDLYVFPVYSKSGKVEQPASFWDVMGGGGDFFGWSKWIAGWLFDDEVLCIGSSQKKSIVYLNQWQSNQGKKLIAIPSGNGEIVLAEYRTNTTNEVLGSFGLCRQGTTAPCSGYKYSGLLIYHLDTKRKHGDAPFKVAQTVEEPLLEVGDSMSYENHSFKVIASDGVGIYVEVSRNN